MAETRGRLDDYNSKRDFRATSEPKGKAKRKRKANRKFLVQKHDATRLHYDLRLEWDGVLLSWAVTRGPSADPSEKRLAVRTEDHPYDYGEFEGTIPKKEYGGGTVMLWDTGTWTPLHDPDAGLKEGKLHFEIDGNRMRGGWALVRMRAKAGEKRENWLLIKERDDMAADDPDALIRGNITSVATGRSMDEIAEDKPAKSNGANGRSKSRSNSRTTAKASSSIRKARTHAKKAPAFRKLQLATLVDEAPDGEDWTHETKFDGYRCLAAVGKGGAKLYTRSGLDWNDRFAVLVPEFESLNCDNALVDGEIVAKTKRSGSAFSALQQALKSGEPLSYYAFDLLVLDGEDLVSEPLIERKKKLESLLRKSSLDNIHFSEHIAGNGAATLDRICAQGGEGIVSKKADAPYRGTRTRAWLKVKCSKRQEFVVGGYSPSDKAGRPFSSLLLGQYENREFRYRGRVGTGFSESELESLHKTLLSAARKTSPFGDVPRSVSRNAKWTTPKLVVEVDFAEFTDDGHIRHGAYLGTRDDKKAADVKPERAKGK